MMIEKLRTQQKSQVLLQFGIDESLPSPLIEVFLVSHFSLILFLKVWRVGFMGHNSYKENVDQFLRLFKEAIESVKNSS